MTADASADDSINALPPGTRFGELEILGTLGVGGFGIVYLAQDHSLQREIAIKEYMPSQFALRDGRSQVSVRSMSMHETFELGRRSFVNEARLLARFDHPSLLKVYRFWEANGTAYMAMPRLVGRNLREARKTQPTPPPEAWTRRVFDAVLNGLDALHTQQVWHRDVAPDNIFMPADGSAPILLDFGAARQAIGDRTQVFTAILKPSFAPIEQYAEATSLKQGPWTDFYALAAVMHELLTGHPPPPCTARAMGDEVAPLAAEGYAPTFLAALDWALRVAPHQRPASVAAWREVIDGRASVPPPQAAPSRVVAPPPPVAAPAPDDGLDIEFADTVQGFPEDLLPTRVLTPAEAALARPPVPTPPSPPSPPPAQKAKPGPKPTPTPAPGPAASKAKGRGPLLIVAAVVIGVLLLGLFVMLLRGTMAKHEVPAVDAAASAASAALPEPSPIVPASASVADTTPVPVPAASMPVVVPEPQPVQPAVVPASAPPKPRATAASSPGASASAASRRDGALKPAAPVVITEKPNDRPVPRSPVFAAPEQAASAVAQPTRPASTSDMVGVPRTPAEACGGRVLLARIWCIDRQCEKPIYQNDPECVRLRDIRNSRRDNSNNAP